MSNNLADIRISNLIRDCSVELSPKGFVQKVGRALVMAIARMKMSSEWVIEYVNVSDLVNYNRPVEVFVGLNNRAKHARFIGAFQGCVWRHKVLFIKFSKNDVKKLNIDTVWWSQERENEKLLDEHSMEPDDLIVVPESVIMDENGDENDIEYKKEVDAINEFESILRDIGGNKDLAVINQLVKLNVRQVDQYKTVQFYSDRVNQLEVTMAEKFDGVMARSRELEIENARLREVVKNLLK